VAGNEKKYLSLAEVRNKYNIVNQTFNDIQTIYMLLNRLTGNLFDTDLLLAKQDNLFVSRQKQAKIVARNPGDDRVFPFNTVELQRYSSKHEIDIEKATIHIGPYANELARSFNALALTIGSDIFFRDKAYNPGSEEGRKVIAHELTHVAQHTERRITKNVSRETLEAEAGFAEKKEVYDKNAIVVLNIRGNRYMFSRSKMEYYANKVSVYIKNRVMEQKYILEEKEYLKLLYAYEKWIKEG